MSKDQHNPYAPPSSATETAPAILPTSGPAGLSGWLVLVGFGLFVTPFSTSCSCSRTWPSLLADSFAVTIVLPGQPFMDPKTAGEFVRSVVSASIWVPYLFLSKRVKNTFVRIDT